MFLAREPGTRLPGAPTDNPPQKDCSLRGFSPRTVFGPDAEVHPRQSLSGVSLRSNSQKLSSRIEPHGLPVLARDIELLYESDTEALSEPEEHLGSGRNSLRILLYSEVRHAQGDTASNSDWTLLIKKPEPMVIVPEFWDALVVLKASMASSEET